MLESNIMFNASKLKVERAKQHIVSLEKSQSVFFDGNWYTASFDPDETGRQCLKVGILGLPEHFSEIVGDSVHNLRAALDLLAVEIVAMSGSSTKGVMFPFCSNPKDLENMIKKRNFHRAKDIYKEEIRSLQPYKGGNLALRALHDLDIQDKHHTLIPFVSKVTTPSIRIITEEDGKPKGLDKGELEFEMVPNSLPNVVFCFPIESPLAEQPIIPTLHHLEEMVSDIIDRFETLS